VPNKNRESRGRRGLIRVCALVRFPPTRIAEAAPRKRRRCASLPPVSHMELVLLPAQQVSGHGERQSHRLRWGRAKEPSLMVFAGRAAVRAIDDDAACRTSEPNERVHGSGGRKVTIPTRRQESLRLRILPEAYSGAFGPCGRIRPGLRNRPQWFPKPSSAAAKAEDRLPPRSESRVVDEHRRFRRRTWRSLAGLSAERTASCAANGRDAESARCKKSRLFAEGSPKAPAHLSPSRCALRVPHNPSAPSARPPAGTSSQPGLCKAAGGPPATTGGIADDAADPITCPLLRAPHENAQSEPIAVR